MSGTKTYKVVRFYRDERSRRELKTGLTLEQAQDWCTDPATRDEDWFDGYEEE